MHFCRKNSLSLSLSHRRTLTGDTNCRDLSIGWNLDDRNWQFLDECKSFWQTCHSYKILHMHMQCILREIHIIINLTWSGVLYHVEWMLKVIPSDHPRCYASRVIQWYGLIHETWYCTPDQVTIIIICLLYAFFSDILSDFKTCFGL